MSLSKDLVFLILQFCDEENLKRTAHMLEQETGYFFDLQYFEELVLLGNWEEAEKYISSFTAVDDNNYSTKIYFEIRKQKYLESLDKEHDSLTFYGDVSSARKRIINDLRSVIEANPLLQGRTKFPQINKSRLRRLINQSLNWQHIHCANPHPQPHIDTLFTDHKCPEPDNVLDQLNKDSSLTFFSKNLKFSGQSNKELYQEMTQLLALDDFSLNWQHIHCANPHPQPHIDTLFTDHKCPEPDNVLDQLNKDSSLSSVTESKITTVNVNNQEKRSNQDSGDDKDARHDASDLKSTEPVDDKVPSPTDISGNELPSEFPRNVERVINMGSAVKTMDFNPVHETLLLVGKSVGDIELWDVASAQKLSFKEFVVSGDDLAKNPGISVNRVLWSSDGALFGVAYSKRIIHLYLHHTNGNHFKIQLEIDAHVGSVNDIAFSKPNEKLVVISCGDDKLIQVWDAVTGVKQYTFEGHDAPVYSLCPHNKKDVHFLFSVSTSGEIKAWLFDNNGSRLTYDAPGFCCMRIAYSTDGQRLFSCGTNKKTGDSYIVEWNEREGFIIRNYHGLSKCCSAMVHFDTSKNRFMAVGDEHLIKIWDMDSAEILAVIDADGDLTVGNLLAVSADDNRIKILANDDGRELLPKSVFVSGDSSGCLTESFSNLSVNPTPGPLKAVLVEGNSTRGEALDVWEYFPRPQGPAIFTKIVVPNISKVVEVTRCQSVRLTSEVEVNLIRRLLYARAGNAILALAEDGTHLLWKWAKSDANSSGLATTKCAPQLYQPKAGLLMINDIPEDSNNVLTPSFTWSKNDSYIISASGGMVNLYNTLTFKNLRSVMPPPPAATCIMFYPPDNNVIAIGLDDSTILIFNIREDNLLSTLQGHSSRISGLIFSATLNVLISCAVDTEIVLWDTVTWEKKRSTVLQISVGWFASDLSETNVQLDKDHNHFLAVHETQLAIYETMTLRRVKQWTIANFCTRISHATYSCDSEFVYAVMRDGILLILGASDLAPRFEIGPSAYLPSYISSYVDPVVVAAHPDKPCQFALGMSNGEVFVIEPLGYDEGKWTAPPLARI
ncbi:topless-related protein 1 [Phtheirospermum japonicum]|uniref:Topless-related protein 1 n=1 Tax=Phtheirospermum japonicum TaxID=374723 RepID=A0A830CZL0_9LAMI|nr:topless-related protein 1 [Phtheirospermum japonicum]